jgi:hypothetical protein
LHEEERQPVEKLDEVIEEIRRLMLSSTQETIIGRKMNRGKTAIATGKMQQQQRSSGVDGQLQRTVWDPGGF